MNGHVDVLDDARTTARSILDTVKREGRTSLTAPEARELCEAWQIPIPKEALATTADQAAAQAQAIGFPVVLKIVSPQILHKTEAGGVLVGVKSADDVRAGFKRIVESAGRYDPKAEIL